MLLTPLPRPQLHPREDEIDFVEKSRRSAPAPASILREPAMLQSIAVPVLPAALAPEMRRHISTR
jgi:hypothetical protein